MATLKLIGAKEFEKAIARNPKVVLYEGKKLIQRTKSYITRQLVNNPWRIGDMSGKGKGIPVLTGRLRGSLLSKFIRPLTAKLYINMSQVAYANAVHNTRPFMDRAKTDAMPLVKKESKKFLKIVVKELSK